MNHMLPLVISWAVLATAILVLALYRRSVVSGEDDYLHVESTAAVAKQEAIAKKLEGIDRWGKLLTIIAVVFALALLGMFLYNGWNDSATKLS